MNEWLQLQRGEDQRVKPVVRAKKTPAEVCVALAADRDLPRPAGEPRERVLRRPDGRAAGSGAIATHVMHDPGGVDEGVLVRPGHLDPMAAIGDPVIANTAAHRVIVAIVGA